nr:116_t:CDS:2 [Entrophospora candida]
MVLMTANNIQSVRLLESMTNKNRQSHEIKSISPEDLREQATRFSNPCLPSSIEITDSSSFMFRLPDGFIKEA